MTDDKLWLLYSKIWNNLCAKKILDSFVNIIYKICLQIIYIYTYERHLALNNMYV